MSTWEVVAAVSSAVGAVGTSAAAGAAWLSVREARLLSRDAADALAVATAPTLALTDRQMGLRVDRWPVDLVVNVSGWPARDVELELCAHGRVVVSARTAWLGPSRWPHWRSLTELSGDEEWVWLPALPGGPLEGGDVATSCAVRYADARGHVRWEMVLDLPWVGTEGTATPRRLDA
jgi:hypothetical protein